MEPYERLVAESKIGTTNIFYKPFINYYNYG